MKIINVQKDNIPQIEDEICAAIGNFDGVHLGHQELINQSKKHNLKSAVLTFYPHPNLILKKLPYYHLITPLKHKIEIFEGLNVDYLIIVDFTDDLAKMDKKDFIVIMKKLNIKVCVCGYDFTFGYKALGNINDLKEHFQFYEIEKYTIDKVRVSTTYIKELLEAGLVDIASTLLGRYFSIKSLVNHGNKIGSLIGYKTANINKGNYYIPKTGVYMCNVLYNNKIYLAVCNIGFNPTINFSEEKKIEVHIIDFDEDIYDKEITVYFIKYIRNEKKFNNIDQLINQLKEDVMFVKNNKFIIDNKKLK